MRSFRADRALISAQTQCRIGPMPLNPDQQRAVDSLTGLSIGDAFGDQFFLLSGRDLSPSTDLPAPPVSPFPPG